MKFDSNTIKNELIDWIKKYFEENGPTSKAVISISGGKDSTTVAKLCVEALGKDRVVGVLIPNGYQHDIDVARKVVEYLDIEHYEINIKQVYTELLWLMYDKVSPTIEENKVFTSNTPARIRMTVLYGISAIIGGRVANTCNLSEDYVGYATKYGDAAGDFSPLSNLTVQEVKAVAYSLGIPKEFIEKTPEDGLCGVSDEENLGFTYDVLDRYIRTGICEDLDVKEKIDKMHLAGLHKITPMPSYKPNI